MILTCEYNHCSTELIWFSWKRPIRRIPRTHPIQNTQKFELSPHSDWAICDQHHMGFAASIEYHSGFQVYVVVKRTLDVIRLWIIWFVRSFVIFSLSMYIEASFIYICVESFMCSNICHLSTKRLDQKLIVNQLIWFRVFSVRRANGYDAWPDFKANGRPNLLSHPLSHYIRTNIHWK